MTDDRLRRWLEAGEQPLNPDPDFAVVLRDELRQELGFIPTGGARQDPRYVRRVRARDRRGPAHLLLVAALVVASVGAAAVAGALVERTSEQAQDLLTQVRESGRIRIAVRPDHPQFSGSGQPTAGFDIDVASALADHLGVRDDIVVIDAAAIQSGEDDDLWDVALPSVAVSELDSTRFLVSSPYYRWPHRLVVAETATATGATDLAGEPICAVAGDAGERWLRGEYGDTASTPVTTRIVTRASDDDCLSGLAAGEVVAVVTAKLSDADLQVRPGIKVIGGPEPEPRAVIARRATDVAADPTDLLRAIDDALAGMRRDGTLTRLSQNRFGGADLTAP
jgi:L-cystine transport system substrate-binding protein